MGDDLCRVGAAVADDDGVDLLAPMFVRECRSRRFADRVELRRNVVVLRVSEATEKAHVERA